MQIPRARRFFFWGEVGEAGPNFQISKWRKGLFLLRRKELAFFFRCPTLRSLLFALSGVKKEQSF